MGYLWMDRIPVGIIMHIPILVAAVNLRALNSTLTHCYSSKNTPESQVKRMVAPTGKICAQYP